MPDVLIRNVPADDLDVLRAAAAARGMSLQSYLREAVDAQAAYLRRQDALVATVRRLRSSSAVPEAERTAVLEAIADDQAARVDALGDRPAR